MQGLGRNETTGLFMMHHDHPFLITSKNNEEFESVLSVPEFNEYLTSIADNSLQLLRI